MRGGGGRPAPAGPGSPGEREGVDAMQVGRRGEKMTAAWRPAFVGLVFVVVAVLLLTACGAPAAAPRATAAGSSASAEGGRSEMALAPPAEAVPAEAPAAMPAVTEDGRRVVRLTLPVEPRTLEVAPGLAETVWTFAGRVPGPVIRVRQGDTVEITLENRDTISHSIDFHAARVAPNVQFADVAPGESRVVRFVAKDAGVFMYHCATAPMIMHIAMGMYGMIIVDPEGGREPAREIALVQSEFYRGMDMAAMESGQAAAVVFNGKADQYVEAPIQAKVGETVRIYFVDAGPDHFSAFHVVGTIFDRVEPDGVAKNAQYGVSTYTVAPGGGAVFETHFDEPGRYAIVTHSAGDMMLGAKAIIEVTK